jgi:hypothetical protein
MKRFTTLLTAALLAACGPPASLAEMPSPTEAAAPDAATPPPLSCCIIEGYTICNSTKPSVSVDDYADGGCAAILNQFDGGTLVIGVGVAEMEPAPEI